jgi:hypothetical protein
MASGVATRKCLTTLLAGVLALGVSVIGSAGPAAAGPLAATTSYDCAADLLTVQVSQSAASDWTEDYLIGFGKAGAIDTAGSVYSDITGTRTQSVVLNTDDLGRGAIPFTTGDTVQVWFLEHPDYPAPASQILSEGEVVGTFAYCGAPSTTKAAIPTNSDSRAYSYKGWTGSISYDCQVNALSYSRTHPAPIAPADYMAEVYVHEGGAGIAPGYATFRASSPSFEKLMPHLSAGERIDVYAVPFDWLGDVQPPYPFPALAEKIKKGNGSQPIYSFKYGSCGSLSLPGGTDLCASKPGIQTKPCPPLYMVTVKWPKVQGKGGTFKVRICQVGKSCTAWRSTGTKRSATFKDLELGKHVVLIKASGGKPIRVKFTVTTKFRRSK